MIPTHTNVCKILIHKLLQIDDPLCYLNFHEERIGKVVISRIMQSKIN